MAGKKKIPKRLSLKLPAVTITKVLSDFLDEQGNRLKPKTFGKYEEVIELLSRFINDYAYNYLNDEETELFDELCEVYGMGFCDVFGPEHILSNVDEFLGYFLVRKVIADKSLLKSSGTVIKKLAKWLVERGYVEDIEDVLEVASKASKELPLAEELRELLYDYSRGSYFDDFEETVEDIFVVKKIEKGKIWLSGFIYDEDIGPVPVPEEFSRNCRVDWCINSAIGRTGKGWKIVEVYQVEPE